MLFKNPHIHKLALTGDTETKASLSGVQQKVDKKKADIEVWAAFQNGDEAAFVYIYQQHFNGLYRYGSQFTKDKELIKDCIQDLFIELNENRKKLTAVSFIKFYLFKCLKNKICNYLKKSQRFSLYQSFDKGFDFHFDFSEEQTLINLQIKKENSIKLNNAIEKLTPRQKEIIYYYYHEGLTFDQIKDLMDLNNIKSIKNLLYKAIVMLRQHIPYSLFLLLISKL